MRSSPLAAEATINELLVRECSDQAGHTPGSPPKCDSRGPTPAGVPDSTGRKEMPKAIIGRPQGGLAVALANQGTGSVYESMRRLKLRRELCQRSQNSRTFRARLGD